jgi:hypothetical protein
MADEPSHETAIDQPISQSKKRMGDEQRSLNEWAQFFNVSYGTFKGWASKMKKRSPFYKSDAELIACFGAGKALKARGNTREAGRRNYTRIMEILNGTD